MDKTTRTDKFRAKIIAQLAEYKRDAERYRWLRDATDDVCQESGITLICNSSIYGSVGLEGFEWDKAIDAAMDQTEQKR